MPVLWLGCSVERNYALLSLFFDGVPDPNAPDPQTVTDSRGFPLAFVSRHQPFFERQCSECHVGASDFKLEFSGFAGVVDEVCMKCHEAVPGEHAYMHGPVVAMNCLWCHRPHESRFPHLMRAPDPALCRDCHGPGLMSLESEGHADLDRGCLECHMGHGGSDPYFLRELGSVDMEGGGSTTDGPADGGGA